MSNQFLFETAIAYRKAGRDVIPDHPTDKYPVGFSKWEQKEFTEEELKECILNKGWGIGIRNQEGLDFDNHGNPTAEEVFADWKALVGKVYPGLSERLLIEKTQHGGFHVAWKCEVIEGSQKLASRLPTKDELQKDPKIRSITFIETRGVGGQFVVSPTLGYTLLQGDWCNLPQITSKERDVLLRSAKSLDLMPAATEDFKASGNNFDGERPGDLFNKEGADEALELLKQAGWTTIFEQKNTVYLRRPGKDKGGISATFGHVAPGIFYNFTSNGSPFDPNKAYTPFAVFSLLKHNGDFSLAASELAKRYGLSKSQKADLTPNFLFTDTTNAEKIIELFGNKIRFDHRRKRWLIWEGQRWQPDVDGSINRMAIEAARKRQLEALAIGDRDQREEAVNRAINSENKTRLDAAIGITKNLLPVADSGDNWDADTMLLSCPNGIVDLRTGLIRDGRSEDRITMVAGTAYDPDALCPLWEKFISEIFEGNRELIHYIHKALGYTLTGNVKEQVVFFGFGIGSNGKSVLFSTIRETLKDYAYNAPASMFQRNPMNTSTNDVAATEFKRFLMSSEVLSSTKIDEVRLKKWSGGDQETARFLYSEFFSFYPTCKIWLFVNHKPRVDDDSHGFWRRVKLIPFNRVFKAEEQDKDLTQKLKGELPGILNWLIEGCLLWQKEGLTPIPEIVSLATSVYQQENDVLAEFLADRCVEVGNVETKALEFYKSYTQWADEQGFKGKDILSNTAFGRRMSDKFIKKSKNGRAFYQGVALKNGEDSQNSSGFDGKSVPEVAVDPHFMQTSSTYAREDSLLKKAQNPLPAHENPLQPNSLDSCYQCNGTTFYKNPSGVLTCSRCYPPVSSAENDREAEESVGFVESLKGKK